MFCYSAGNSSPGNSHSVYNWNTEKKEIENEAIQRADYIIHLAGAGIGDKRWTKKRKAAYPQTAA